LGRRRRGASGPFKTLRDKVGLWLAQAAMTDRPNFAPGLGRTELTADYDRVITVMTREKRWRTARLDLMRTGGR